MGIDAQIDLGVDHRGLAGGFQQQERQVVRAVAPVAPTAAEHQRFAVVAPLDEAVDVVFAVQHDEEFGEELSRFGAGQPPRRQIGAVEAVEILVHAAPAELRDPGELQHREHEKE